MKTVASLGFLALTLTIHAQAPTTLRLTPERAVELALEHDLELIRDRFGPGIAAFDERAARTAWTPEISARAVAASNEVVVTNVIDSAESLTDRQVALEIALGQRLPWGASYRVTWDAARLKSDSELAKFRPELRAGMAFTVAQPLLRGLSFDAARAERAIAIQQRGLASTDLDASRATTQREVLHAYWAWVYARDFLAVQRQSLEMAQNLLDGNRERVAKGAMAAVDVIEAEAEVARRAEAILTAEKNVANAEERLRLRIFGSTSQPHDAVLEPEPVADGRRDAPDAATRALTSRHELKSLRTALAIDAIDIRRFRNDALPEVVVGASTTLRGTGGRPFSSVLDDLSDRRYPSWSIELGVSYPIGASQSEVHAARASAQRRQREAALRAAEQRVLVEVNVAVRELETNYQRLEPSSTAVKLAERRLDGEQRKFASGLSTSFFVFQAQRDLSLAREAQLRALLDYRLATVDVAAVQVIPLGR